MGQMADSNQQSKQHCMWGQKDDSSQYNNVRGGGGGKRDDSSPFNNAKEG